MVNTETLRNRLWVIDHYKYRYGANHTFWVHTALGKTFGHLNRYKFNYALKGFLFYQAWSKYQTYRYVNEMSLLTDSQKAKYLSSVATSTAVFGAVCLVI